MFTIAARADVIALFMVLSVYVSVYRIRNLERVCVSERAYFALEKESGCKRGRVLLEGEKEREEKVRGERARKNRSFLNALVAVL